MKTPPNAPRVTVGLVVRNEEHRLRACLQSLVENHLRPEPIRLIVVDNASTDRTVEIAETFLSQSHVNFQVIRRKHNHLAAARNDVISAAQTDFVAFTDADCRVPADWIFRLLSRLLSHPRAAAVGGGNEPPLDHPFRAAWELIANEKFFHSGSLQAQTDRFHEQTRTVPHLSTCNVMYRKSALIEVGGFALTQSRSGEDLDLSYRLRRRGYSLWKEPFLNVEHDIASTWKAWLGTCWKYGRDQLPILARHRFAVDPHRSLMVFGVFAFIGAGLMEPWIWLMALLHPLWFFFKACSRKLSAGRLKTALWASLTHAVYAVACVSGLSTLLLEPFRRERTAE